MLSLAVASVFLPLVRAEPVHFEIHGSISRISVSNQTVIEVRAVLDCRPCIGAFLEVEDGPLGSYASVIGYRPGDDRVLAVKLPNASVSVTISGHDADSLPLVIGLDIGSFESDRLVSIAFVASVPIEPVIEIDNGTLISVTPVARGKWVMPADFNAVYAGAFPIDAGADGSTHWTASGRSIGYYGPLALVSRSVSAEVRTPTEVIECTVMASCGMVFQGGPGDYSMRHALELGVSGHWLAKAPLGLWVDDSVPFP